MAIQELQIAGYRSFKNATWQPGKLNLLVGPNASGKSNLLRMLELISLAATGELYQSIIESGGMPALLWNHESDSLGWKLRIDPVDNDRDQQRDALTFQVFLRYGASTGDYLIFGDSLGVWDKVDRGKSEQPEMIYHLRESGFPEVFDIRRSEFKQLKEFEEHESVLGQIDSQTSQIPVLTSRLLRSWRVYQHINAGYQSRIRQPSVTQYSKTLNPDGANLTAVLHTLYSEDSQFQEKIDDGMRAAFGDEFETLKFPPASTQKVELSVKWRSSLRAHSSIDLSDGTLRFLAILTALSVPELPPLIAIDEPEVGLHPSMLPIIADYAIAASEETQVVISSHSPEFLDYFTDADPHVTVFHWEDAQSHIFDLQPETLSKWLDRYRLGEMFTSNELEMLAQPTVDSPEDIAERFADLPSEDETMPVHETEK